MLKPRDRERSDREESQRSFSSTSPSIPSILANEGLTQPTYQIQRNPSVNPTTPVEGRIFSDYKQYHEPKIQADFQSKKKSYLNHSSLVYFPHCPPFHTIGISSALIGVRNCNNSKNVVYIPFCIRGVIECIPEWITFANWLIELASIAVFAAHRSPYIFTGQTDSAQQSFPHFYCIKRTASLCWYQLNKHSLKRISTPYVHHFFHSWQRQSAYPSTRDDFWE